MKRIAVFASGNGSNAENIIRYFQTDDHRAEVVLVVCNKPDAAVIQRSRNLGITAMVLSRQEINDPQTMLTLLEKMEVDIIVLAGFLLMVPPFLTARYHNRIVNIHPSLLPKYGGKGMFGRHIHEAVVEAGEKETGITIHFVNDHCDEGRIIFQAAIPVEPTDTPADVEEKIHRLEKLHFPRVIADTFCK